MDKTRPVFNLWTSHYPTNYSNPGDPQSENVANTGSWGVVKIKSFGIGIEGDEVYNKVFES